MNLVIQMGDVPLSKFIQNLSFHYTKFIKPVDLVKEHITLQHQTAPDSERAVGLTEFVNGAKFIEHH